MLLKKINDVRFSKYLVSYELFFFKNGSPKKKNLFSHFSIFSSF